MRGASGLYSAGRPTAGGLLPGCNCPHGGFPDAGLTQATDGNFDGTTSSYGANGTGGILFRISPSGKLKTLYSFCAQTDCNDGAEPLAALFQATNGNLYGTADSGGPTSFGTIFGLSTGQAPFVETIPTIGKAGTNVRILGNRFDGRHGCKLQRHFRNVHCSLGHRNHSYGAVRRNFGQSHCDDFGRKHSHEQCFVRGEMRSNGRSKLTLLGF